MPFQRGNTHGKGRPTAGKSLSEALRVALSEKLPDGRSGYRAVADMLVKRARDGDVAAAKEIFNRIEGAVSAAQAGDPEGPRPIIVHVLPQDEKLL